MFLGISKAFDMVWHEGVIFKLKQSGISKNLLELLVNFLKDRKQMVVLNGKVSNWADITAGVPQGSILDPLLIYINDLATRFSSNASEMNNDLAKINNWAFQWKMNFNADLSKQAQEVIFSQKSKKISHLPLFFNNIQVSQFSSQKHLDIILAEQLKFCERLKILTSKINKTIVLLLKLQNFLPRSSLIAIYKAFVRPHLDYGDIISD